MNIPGAFPITPKETFWQWRTLEKDRRGREKWRTLRWRMTEVDAMAWAAKSGNQIEKVSGSGEVRIVTDTPYVGWGQAIRDEGIPK